MQRFNLPPLAKQGAPQPKFTTSSNSSTPAVVTLPPVYVDSKSQFRQIISEMPAAKASELLKILSTDPSPLPPPFNFQAAVKGLYDASDNSREAYEFKEFFKSHTIENIGGGNSRNFAIKSANNIVCVLKAEFRFSQPLVVEEAIRANPTLNSVMTPVHVRHPAVYTKPKDINKAKDRDKEFRLLVTDYCANGNLEMHSKRISDPASRWGSALKIYGQMANILNQFAQEGYAFPDMKNTNWLVDEHGDVRIADSKSFVSIDRTNKKLKIPQDNPQHLSLVTTHYMQPSDFSEVYKNGCDADKLHVHLWARNMFQYLTQCDRYDLSKPERIPPETYDFTHDVFKSVPGKQLKALLEFCLKSKPDERPPMSFVVTQLNELAVLPSPEKYDECCKLLDSLQILVKKDSTKLNKCAATYQLILSAKTPEALEQIKQQLVTELIVEYKVRITKVLNELIADTTVDSMMRVHCIGKLTELGAATDLKAVQDINAHATQLYLADKRFSGWINEYVQYPAQVKWLAADVNKMKAELLNMDVNRRILTSEVPQQFKSIQELHSLVLKCRKLCEQISGLNPNATVVVQNSNKGVNDIVKSLDSKMLLADLQTLHNHLNLTHQAMMKQAVSAARTNTVTLPAISNPRSGTRRP